MPISLQDCDRYPVIASASMESTPDRDLEWDDMDAMDVDDHSAGPSFSGCSISGSTSAGEPGAIEDPVRDAGAAR